MPKKNKKQKKKQNKKTSNIIESKQIMFMKRKFFFGKSEICMRTEFFKIYFDACRQFTCKYL